jgi:heme A synthase
MTMTASAAGSLVLVLVGVAFLAAAVLGWWRIDPDDEASRVRRTTAVLIDLLVGLAALGDGTVSVIGEPEGVVVWSVGSAALVVAVGLLALRHRRHPHA